MGNSAALLRTRARTFYLASLFFPPAIRRDIQTVYAFYRTADDLVDEPAPGRAMDDTLATLALWEDVLTGGRAPEDPLLADLLRVAELYSIPSRYLTMMVDGVRFDLTMQSITTLEELLEYAVLVAGSVGLVVGTILGARGDGAMQSARDLGVAMQLTNILRDVGEDLSRGRIYLPVTELSRAGCSVDDLHAHRRTAGFLSVMTQLSSTARTLYQSGVSGIGYLDPSARFAVYLAAQLYARILDTIEANEFDVFERRAHLTVWQRCAAVVPCYLAYRRVTPEPPLADTSAISRGPAIEGQSTSTAE